ncbi:Transmembrane protein [Senna tora]|uniref:Transmembrane protein n=1 Tax=Senna tora TaxID=362788 RepID=A0A834T836_9FABA|nr:Transmembrane protein [Senna tora]
MGMEKSVWGVLGMIMLVVSCHFSFAHCRVLRSETEDGCKNMMKESESSLGMASFAVSSNNATVTQRPSLRTLEFLLASGPSRKGPGH